MRAIRQALRQRDLRLMLAAGLVSMTGDWVLRIGLTYYVFVLTGSTLASALMLLTSFAPQIVLGSLAGVFVDRWDLQRTMIVTDALLAVGLLPLLAVHRAEQMWIVYLVSAGQGCIQQFFTPAQQSLLPRLIDDEHLITANALGSQNNDVSRLVGSAIGGVVTALGGITPLTLVDALSFLLSAGFIAAIHTDRPDRRIRHMGSELRAGSIAAIHTDRPEHKTPRVSTEQRTRFTAATHTHRPEHQARRIGAELRTWIIAAIHTNRPEHKAPRVSSELRARFITSTHTHRPEHQARRVGAELWAWIIAALHANRPEHKAPHVSSEQRTWFIAAIHTNRPEHRARRMGDELWAWFIAAVHTERPERRARCIGGELRARFIATIRTDRPEHRARRMGGELCARVAQVRVEWADGLRLSAQHRVLRVIGLFVLVTCLGEGVMGTLFAPYVRASLHASSTMYGVISAAQAIGGVCGGLLAASLGHRSSAARVMGLSALAFGIIDLALFLYPLAFVTAWPAIVLMILVGGPGALLTAAATTLLQRNTTPTHRGRVFGALGAIEGAAIVAGALAAGFLGKSLGIIPTIAAQGGGYVLAGLLVVVTLYGDDGSGEASKSP